MFCNHCGAPVAEIAQVCQNCGTAVRENRNAVNYATPVKRVAATYVPEENSPLSPWAYFGLQLLFAIPIVGFIFLIIFSCNGSNINRRNFARSYWCALLVVAAIVLIYVIIIMSAGGSLISALRG